MDILTKFEETISILSIGALENTRDIINKEILAREIHNSQSLIRLGKSYLQIKTLAKVVENNIDDFLAPFSRYGEYRIISKEIHDDMIIVKIQYNDINNYQTAVDNFEDLKKDLFFR